MFKTIMVAGALALGLVIASPVGPARAGVHADIGMHLNGGTYDPYYWRARRGISCREGVQIVYSAGFKKVRPLDCNGSEYTYLGRQGGDRYYKITLSARSGNIKHVERFRRGGDGWGGGGWGGGYGDDDDDYGGYGDDYNDGDY